VASGFPARIAAFMAQFSSKVMMREAAISISEQNDRPLVPAPEGERKWVGMCSVLVIRRWDLRKRLLKRIPFREEITAHKKYCKCGLDWEPCDSVQSLNDGDTFWEMRRWVISSLCERHRVYLHKPRYYSLLHT
jgi:hypothetical protein